MDNKPFHSISGVPQETTEPVDVGEHTPRSPTPTQRPPKTVRESSTSSSRTTKKPQQRAITSATNSPLPSRESSPIRPQLKANTSSRSTAGPGRPRKESSQDISPARSTTSINPPSAAATQRALSTATTPSLHPSTSEPIIKAPVPQKPSIPSEIRETPRWPVSPRLRSPPPITRPNILSPRKTDPEISSFNVHKSFQVPEEARTAADSDAEDSLPLPGMRTPARGVSGASSTLETVQEISQPNTPGSGLDGILEKVESNALVPNADQESGAENGNQTIKEKPSLVANESGSESGGKGEIKLRATSAAPTSGTIRPNGPSVKSSFTSGGVGRGKPSGEGSTRNMTVETETVSSIPQVAVGTGGPGNNGSIRAKISSETIRPKKDKKKTVRKAPSVTSGTASSKADIFEAKVASAVDEANSSDSEETFVYESNPPDANDRPRRFHSRTPSATSMASQVDQRNGVRAIMDGHHSVALKKSMKFAQNQNSYSSNGPDSMIGEDDGKGTARSSAGTGRGTTHHHHIGRWGAPGRGNGHQSLFDNESPFPNATKSKLSGNNSRQSSRPTSPRFPNMRMTGNGKRPIPSAYDFDDGADDERTPLVSTVRSSRSGRARRPAGTSRQLEHQTLRQNKTSLASFSGCLILTLMLILVVSGVIGFMFATTQPLKAVNILALNNVLASEQDIIFDMKVEAINTNLVAVTIESADLVVFAKSKYAGTDSEYWKRPSVVSTLRRALRIRDDDPHDPPVGAIPGSSPNLEIGRIHQLDTPLMFEGSPFHMEPSYSTAEMRIEHPGNHTLPAGSERWGKVIKHEFDLIVRGTLKYTLPLSQKLRNISVNGVVIVKPNAADKDPDKMHTTW